MIKITTYCFNCLHKDICKFKGNAECDMKKLKNMTYGNGPNDDYDWDIMSISRHYNITFSCDMYEPIRRETEK